MACISIRLDIFASCLCFWIMLFFGQFVIWNFQSLNKIKHLFVCLWCWVAWLCLKLCIHVYVQCVGDIFFFFFFPFNDKILFNSLVFGAAVEWDSFEYAISFSFRLFIIFSLHVHHQELFYYINIYTLSF